jgi:hypothetical protein
MGPIAGPGPFHDRRALHAYAFFDECRHIVTPPHPIEIDRQEPARLVEQERVHPNDMLTLEMPADGLVVDAEKRPVWALSAFDPRLLAYTVHPLIGAGGRVSFGLFLGVGPEPSEDFFPPAEQLAEEPDPVRCQGGLRSGRGRWSGIRRRSRANDCLVRAQRIHAGTRLTCFSFQFRKHRFGAG